jgi:hypothetical protein
MRAKEEIRRCRSRGNGISVTYLVRFFWFLVTAIGLISWLMAFWLCASSGSPPDSWGLCSPSPEGAGGWNKTSVDALFPTDPLFEQTLVNPPPLSIDKSHNR